MAKFSATFLGVYDHGIGKGMPLPKLQTQRAQSASGGGGNVRGGRTHTG